MFQQHERNDPVMASTSSTIALCCSAGCLSMFQLHNWSRSGYSYCN